MLPLIFGRKPDVSPLSVSDRLMPSNVDYWVEGCMGIPRVLGSRKTFLFTEQAILSPSYWILTNPVTVKANALKRMS